MVTSRAEIRWGVIKRWIDVAAYAFVGIVFVCMFYKHIAMVGEMLMGLSSSWICEMIFFGVFPGFGMTIILNHMGAAPRIKRDNICIWCRYPPSWLAVIAPILILITMELYPFNVHSFTFSSAKAFFCSGMMVWGFILGIISSICYRWLREGCTKAKHTNTVTSPPDREEAAESEGARQLTSEKIIHWIMDEAPIRSNNMDFFDAEVYASRIVEKIRKRSFQNCALVGRYGTGKSSVLNLVKEKLLGKDFKLESSSGCSKICVCRVDGWGCVREKVPEAILKQAVHELQNYIDCLAVSRLPIRYQQALERLPSPGPVMGAIIIEPTDAATELEKLNSILDTAGVHLVILLEDIDRNGKKGEKAMGVEVPALLDRLKGCDAITVIVTLGLENPNADVLVRVCEHREDLISRIDNMVDVIRKFREDCLTKYPDDLDPVKRTDRDKRFMQASESISEFFTVHKDGNAQREKRSVVYDLAKEIFTPRYLKSVLRRTYQTWDRLHGEIDFDELLVMNTLRISEPLGSFIQKNRDLLQRLHYTKEKSEREEVRKRIYAKWNRFNGNGDAYAGQSDDKLGFSREAFYTCMKFIFPLIQDEMDRFDLYPQSIALSHVNDYWERYHLEEIPENQVRDQTVYRAIDKWREDCSAKVINNRTLAESFVEDREYRLIMEDVFTSTHFGLFNTDEVENTMSRNAKTLADHPEKEAAQQKLMEFASEVLFYIVKQYSKRTSWRKLDLGRFWEIVDSFSANTNFFSWCLSQYKQFLLWDMNYANQIFLKFAFVRNDKKFLDDYLKAIFETFDGDPHALLQALPDNHLGSDSDYPFPCFNCVELGLPHGYQNPKFAQDQINQFMDLMVKAARINPSVMIPQIARFLVGYDEEKDKFKLADPRLLDRFTDSIQGEILDLFASDAVSLEGLNSRVSEIVRLARELARWIKNGEIELEPKEQEEGEQEENDQETNDEG